MGGFSNPSVPRSPGVTLQEKAGRPMGPSTLQCEFPWEFLRVCVRYVFLGSSGRCLFNVQSLFFSGFGCLFGTLSPSRPDPCLVLFVFVLFFLFVWFVRRHRIFLFSLSQALGKPKPFWFGFPLVFSWPRSLTTPVLRGRHLHPGYLPHLFFSSPSSFVFSVVVGLLLSGLSIFSWWFWCGLCMHERETLSVFCFLCLVR